MNVQSFMMVGGVEVIARIVSDTDATITIEKPFVVASVPQKDGVGVSVAPFSAANPSGPITILKSAMITTTYPPNEQLVQHYIRMTTGIELL